MAHSQAAGGPPSSARASNRAPLPRSAASLAVVVDPVALVAVVALIAPVGQVALVALVAVVLLVAPVALVAVVVLTAQVATTNSVRARIAPAMAPTRPGPARGWPGKRMSGGATAYASRA